MQLTNAAAGGQEGGGTTCTHGKVQHWDEPIPARGCGLLRNTVRNARIYANGQVGLWMAPGEDALVSNNLDL